MGLKTASLWETKIPPKLKVWNILLAMAKRSIIKITALGTIFLQKQIARICMSMKR
ncbi:MAG: hypothetical protein ACPL1Z_01315 [Candidatus Bathyarchaeales archaeon]|jgi:hypothetical protein